MFVICFFFLFFLQQSESLKRELRDMKPSTFGYSTTLPVDRDSRHMIQHRERRDTAMITGQVKQLNNPTATTVAAAGYMDESSRLRTNAVADLQKQRQQSIEHRNRVTDNLRDTRVQRESARQQSLQSEHEKSLRDGALLAGTSLRNTSSVPFNLINHEFNSDEAKRKAKYEDDWTKHSFMKRTEKLERTINPSGYNIINGVDRAPVPVPPKPAPLS